MADVQGTFTFNQEGVTPNDELFNVFGAALTSMCSKPSVEMLDNGEGVANYYVNVGGNIEKNFTVNVSEMKEAEQQALMGARARRANPSARPPLWAYRSSRSSAWRTSKKARIP